MNQSLLKGAARLQEMADMANPQQVEENCAKVFMARLPHVQAASRRLQSQLEIHGDEKWPLPPLPDDRNPFIIETNAMKIRNALEDCKNFAVTTDRESGKFQYLDVAATYGQKREAVQAGQAPEIRLTPFENKEKVRESQRSNVIARLNNKGRQEELKELEDEGLSANPRETFNSDIPDQDSEVSSSPEPLFHSVGSSLPPTTSQTSQGSIRAVSEDGGLLSAQYASRGGSSVDTAGIERSEHWEKRPRDPGFRGVGLCGWPEYDLSLVSNSGERSHATGATPVWVEGEHATPNSDYDSDGNSISYHTPIVSSEDREMRTQSHETESGTETVSAALEHIPATISPPSRDLEALSVHDSEREGTQSVIEGAIAILNTDDGREKGSSVADSASYASQTQQNGKGKQTNSDLRNIYTDDGKRRCGKMTGSSGKEIDVAASLRNHAVTYIDETQLKAKERNPPVPQPEMMPRTLTEAICNYIPLEAKPVLTLTLERVDPPVASPTNQRCILLKHFEVGLDGIEGLCQGTAKIPETPEVTAERERRIGKLGTYKEGAGGFYRSLRSAQQKDQQYGKGYWYFFGVKFKQTSRERKLRRGGKWLLFGAPIEAVYHLDIKRNQENLEVLLGGGVDKSGTPIKPFKASFKRTHTLFSRGGLAPMDIWQDGEDWDDGVFKEIRAAMANNGLRVGFLYGDTQTFHPKPLGFPASGKFQAEKKRKQAEPDMTEEETIAMENSMKPKRLSDEDIGAILAMGVVKNMAKPVAARR